MTMDLDRIAKSLLTASDKLSPKEKAQLQDLVGKGNTLIEVLTFLVKTESPKLYPLLETVIDEIFVDFHVAVTLAMAGQLKSSCVLLRTCLEGGLYVLFFIDHPIEANLWANHSKDMSFNEVINTMALPEYFQAATGTLPTGNINSTASNLRDVYKALSERVHGKYSFLQQAVDKPELLLPTFIDLADRYSRDLLRLSFFRSTQPEQLKIEIPGIERLL